MSCTLERLELHAARRFDVRRCVERIASAIEVASYEIDAHVRELDMWHVDQAMIWLEDSATGDEAAARMIAEQFSDHPRYEQRWRL